MPEKPVGKVEHYYPKAKAAAVGLTDDLKVGDEIHIVGHGDDVRAKVKSLQLDHVPIQEGHAGQHIGVGLGTKVHEGDDVLLVSGGASAPATRATARKAPARKAARKPARKAGRAQPKRKAARKAAGRRKPAKGRKSVRKAVRGKPKRKAARKAGGRRKPARRSAKARRRR